MRFTTGSPLQFSPGTSGWVAEFQADNETWTQQVIGWAVVIEYEDYVGRDPDSHGGDGANCETVIQPVLLVENKYLQTTYQYLLDRPGAMLKRLMPPETP